MEKSHTTPAISKVLEKLAWMSSKSIFPGGPRYLWTDAYGVCNYLSLYHALGEKEYLADAESLVGEVYRVLGRNKGLRIGEASDRDGQYYHYLTKWMFALSRLAKVKPEYHAKAVSLVKDVHKHFVVKGVGVHWKMQEDLSAAYPGCGYGGLDFYDGYTMCKLIDESALSEQIGDMLDLIKANYHSFSCGQDLGLGEVLWMAHFSPAEDWAKALCQRSVATLDTMWVEAGGDRGYFCRQPGKRKTKFAFTNFGVSVGLQSIGLWPDRVRAINTFFETYRSGDEYDADAITHVMHCSSLYPGVFI